MPFFSIIVVCLNAENLIGKTIQSILCQTYGDFEIIVKDGGSSDQTVRRVPQDNRVKLFVENDSGIYDAMNQAIAYCHGRFLLYLNCGDTFADHDVLFTVHNVISESHYDKEKEIFYGDYYRDGIYVKQPSHIRNFTLFRTPINHQTMFFSREVLDKQHGFDTAYKIRADHDLTIRAFHHGVVFVHTKSPVSIYQGGGFSERQEIRERANDEFKWLRERNFSRPQRAIYGFLLALTMQKLRNKVMSFQHPLWFIKLYRKMANIVNH